MVWIYDFVDDGEKVTFKYPPENSSQEGVLQYDRATDDFTVIKKSEYEPDPGWYIPYAKRGFRDLLKERGKLPEDPTKKFMFMWY